MGDPGLECSGGKGRPLRKGDGYADTREVSDKKRRTRGSSSWAGWEVGQISLQLEL